MKPTRETLRSHYAELNDNALLGLAAQRSTLTPEAQEVLAEELLQRGLIAPDELLAAVEAEPAPAPVWVTVERFRDLSSAIVARGALQASGIDCFLRDENTVRLDWQISNFIGGMRLQVREEDAVAARDVLTDVALSTTGSDLAPEPEEHCPFCGSTDVHRIDPLIGLRAAALWLLALPLPRGASSWHCASCDRHFPEHDLVLLP